MNEQHSIEWIYHLCINSSADEHLGFFFIFLILLDIYLGYA